MVKVSQVLETLARETNKSEAEVVAWALEVGLLHLWREQLLSHYLHGDIERADVIERIGLDWVELAERQRDAIQEVIAWAFSIQ